MKKAWAVLVIGMVVSGLSARPVCAQHQGMMGEMGRSSGIFYLLFKGADLTADQRAKVREILAAHRAKARDLIRQLSAAREDLMDKLFAPGAVTADDLQPLRQRIAQLSEQLSHDRLAAVLQIRALLTPEQLAKVQKLKDRVRELHAQMRALFEETAKP